MSITEFVNNASITLWDTLFQRPDYIVILWCVIFDWQMFLIFRFGGLLRVYNIKKYSKLELYQ